MAIAHCGGWLWHGVLFYGGEYACVASGHYVRHLVGMGIVLVSIIGWVVYRQVLDVPAMIGMGLIIAGAIVINVFSKSVVH